ncbi:neuropeptide Y receptor type 1-like [Orbicella faveolata]|uniref:neuropeptide Y receptor type 1-like n=1 Tax=Orbicella faveolata TaxID=48498 RepID=UPI0009E33EF5|nr:neuropeptide Y receptor type 1-like [Orbicella faveolata]XP_020630249.1 neuropeptide Y receptor type 1-like [Orbicella faveolata]
MNGTHDQPASCFSDLAAGRIGKTFAYCLIFIVSLVGNTLIGIIVYKTKTMRTSTNFLLVNMAMSDLLLPIFLFPKVVAELYVDSWLISGPLGQVLCKLHIFVSDVSATVSTQSLMLIAVDRFGAVVFPLRSPLINPKLCLFFIPVTWIIAMAIQSPHLFAFRLVGYPGKLVCARVWSGAFGESSSLANYALAIFVVFLYTPLVLMTILYFIIVLKLKSQPTPGEHSINAAQQREKRERNLLKMVVAIVLSFALCWVPFTIFILVAKVSCSTIHYFFIVLIAARANCAINPCICLIFSRNYRQGLKSLFSCFSSLQTSNEVAPVGS